MSTAMLPTPPVAPVTATGPAPCLLDSAVNDGGTRMGLSFAAIARSGERLI
jgi:hypothetical protein